MFLLSNASVARDGSSSVTGLIFGTGAHREYTPLNQFSMHTAGRSASTILDVVHFSSRNRTIDTLEVYYWIWIDRCFDKATFESHDLVVPA